jgi:transglutaminase-like putative cysteine protease
MALDGPVVATLELHPNGLARTGSVREWFPGAAPEAGAIALRLDQASPSSPPADAHRRASFFVDMDQPSVVALRAEVVKASGPTPTIEDLTRFVDRWIAKKNMSRILDPASTVARRREGDCTEHAVLLAALARLFERPSRVVLGVALLRSEGGVAALGHAWTEIHDGRKWRVADAAAAGLPVAVRYLPLAAIADEGPAFASAVGDQLSAIDIRRVVLGLPR